MAVVAPQRVSLDGLDPTYQAADATGDTITVPIGANMMVHVKNGDTAAHTVTLASQVGSPPPGTIDNDEQVSVPAGGERMFGPIGRAFVDADRIAYLTYDAATAVTLAAVQV